MSSCSQSFCKIEVMRKEVRAVDGGEIYVRGTRTRTPVVALLGSECTLPRLDER
jgi:hypothetical protein